MRAKKRKVLCALSLQYHYMRKKFFEGQSYAKEFT